MFCIRIADVVIGIENQYSYIKSQCIGYEIVGVSPAFTVGATEEEISKEQDGNIHLSRGDCESLCIYRKMCCRLARYHAFLMHSAAIAVDGEAYVFAAPSGTGKTTHIRLWLEKFGRRAQVVNGDKPVFRFKEDTLYACGTPWQGKENMGCNTMCPVRAVCFLEQSQINEIRTLTPEEAGRRIFSQLLIPREEQDFNYFWPLVDRLLATVDFYLLRCNMDPKAAELAYQSMRR